MNIVGLEKNKVIHLHWLDSTNSSMGWVYEEDLKAKAKEIESIGFICDFTDKALMITTTRSSSGGVVDPITIPIGCIQKYTILDVR